MRPYDSQQVQLINLYHYCLIEQAKELCKGRRLSRKTLENEAYKLRLEWEKKEREPLLTLKDWIWIEKMRSRRPSNSP